MYKYKNNCSISIIDLEKSRKKGVMEDALYSAGSFDRGFEQSLERSNYATQARETTTGGAPRKFKLCCV